MPWLLFVLAAGAIWMAFSTFSIGLASVCLILALGLIIAGALMLASSKISGQSQSPARMLDAEALEAVRRRAAATATAGATDPPVVNDTASAVDSLPESNDPSSDNVPLRS